MIGVPIYFYLPQSDIIVTVVLLLRFAAQLLRLIMIYRHQKQRRAYINAASNDIVDFSTFEDSIVIARNQGIADDGKLLTSTSVVHNSNSNFLSNLMKHSNNNSKRELSGNIKDITGDWSIIDGKQKNANNNYITPLISPNASETNKNKEFNYPDLRENDITTTKAANENSSLTDLDTNNTLHNRYDSFSENERDREEMWNSLNDNENEQSKNEINETKKTETNKTNNNDDNQNNNENDNENENNNNNNNNDETEKPSDDTGDNNGVNPVVS